MQRTVFYGVAPKRYATRLFSGAVVIKFWRGCLGVGLLNKATADPNYGPVIRVFVHRIFEFGPFWSGNSNTPDESGKRCSILLRKTVLVIVLRLTPGHFKIKNVRGYHFLSKSYLPYTFCAKSEISHYIKELLDLSLSL